ncbi:MAG: alpha-amylase family glycosyl hydrolase [Acidimicrobiia bacterium]|nr:alpha-amylase family glycosyl hydrolase [Acidimicrobiia bacterium]
MTNDWMADAVFYEIYPQSFADSNGDGIGDLRGVIDHLDHLAWLGVDAIWFNPLFASPFVDAGYDVSDYLRVAPRYGTNDDMLELIAAAGERGIRIILDLVAGHTSTEHEWFQAELAAPGPHPDGDRYVWRTDPPPARPANQLMGTPAWVPSPGQRPGWYLKNFFDAQPALNFGWARNPAGEPWRDAVDAPGPRRNRQALRDILDFWLSRGVAGFRVDMAFSLVKDDPGLTETVALWREIRAWLDATHPDAVLIPEGTEPRTGRSLAFHADFFLVIHAEHASLFDNGFAGVLPFQDQEPPFFDAAGHGSTRTFLDGWDRARQVDPNRPIMMASADHDYDRLACGPRTAEQLGAAWTFLLTWGSIPCVYYGDEIGMRFLPGMPEVEGSVCNPGYNRAGCRTPMQWDRTANAGFSTAAAEGLYLPIDPDQDRPTVADQLDDPSSTLHLVRDLIRLRRETPALRTRSSQEVVNEGYPFAFVRGGSHLVVVNPRREAASLIDNRLRGATLVFGSGIGVAVDEVAGDTLTVDGFGYAILALAG